MKSATVASMYRGHTLGVLLFECIVGASTMAWARDLFAAAGPDAWVSVLLAGAASLLLGLLVTYAVTLFPEAQAGGLLVKALGPWFGGLLSLGFAFYALAQAAWVGRTAVELLHFAVLPRTPDWVMLALGLVITGVLLLGGIEAILRYQFTIFWPTLLLAVLSLSMGFRFADWGNFLPILGRGPLPVVQGLGATIEPILGLEMGLVYLPYFLHRGVSVPVAFRGVLGGTTAVLALYLFYTVGITIGFGPFEPALLTWPLLEEVRRTFLTGLFFERLDILYLISLMTATTSALTLYTHAGVATLRQTFALRPRPWHVLACALAVEILAIFPRNLAELEWWQRQLVQYMGLIYLVPVPLLVIAAGLVRRYGRDAHG